MPGTVLETIDAMAAWDSEENATLLRSRSVIRSIEPRLGVFFSWSPSWIDGEAVDRQTGWPVKVMKPGAEGDLLVASIGAFMARVGAGVTVGRGKLLESAGNGTARVRGDDLFRSCTIGKISSVEVIGTYPDGSYLVPCRIIHPFILYNDLRER